MSLKPIAEGKLPERDGHGAYYAIYGDPKGQPLLMVHGGFGHTFDMQKMTAATGSGARVIVLHQRGVGKSKPTGEHRRNTVTSNIGDIERLRRGLGIQQWDVFAWSFGNVLAAAHAFTHPGTCKSLTAYAPYFASDEDYQLLHKTVPTQAQAYFDFHRAETGHDIVKTVHAHAKGDPASVYNAYSVTQRIYDPTFDSARHFQSKTDAEWAALFKTRRIGAQLDEEMFFTHDRALARLAVKQTPDSQFPVTLVFGERDNWVQPHRYTDEVFPKRHTMIVKSAGHDVHSAAVQEALIPVLNAVIAQVKIPVLQVSSNNLAELLNRPATSSMGSSRNGPRNDSL